MTIDTVNPADEQVIASYETMPVEEVMGIVGDSHAAFLAWRERNLAERAGMLPALARVLRDKLDHYAALSTLEMGKPISEARAEVEKCAWLCEVYAEHSEAWLAEEKVAAGGLEDVVVFEPLGVVLSIMPWNYPFWQALRFAVPGIVAGNTSILKHASNVPQCAFAIEEAFRLAGFPKDVFRTVLADHATVAAMMESDDIVGVSLTGSTGAGVRIAQAAGANLKKVVLELGGSDPFIVLADSNLDFAARGAVQGRMVGTGQSCIASKRFIVEESVADAFSERFAGLMAELKVGDPSDPATQVGPVVNAKALAELQSQLADSLAVGGRLLTGGKRLDRPGFFLEPTVVAGCTADMRIVREEVFGPIAPIITVANEEEAIALANDSEFGLGGSVWTADLERGKRVARRIESGMVFVNSFVKSDPRLPFGGVKKSGIGRELSHYGLREFVNVKSISIYAQD